MTITHLIRTACMDCGLTWLKPWPEPVDDTGPVQNHSLCRGCFDVRYPETAAVVRANEEAS